jgi:hypothetical protein
LKSPASSELSALSEVRFPCALTYLWVTRGRRNVRLVSVAFRRVRIPAKHRVYGVGELSVIPLVDANVYSLATTLTFRTLPLKL